VRAILQGSLGVTVKTYRTSSIEHRTPLPLIPLPVGRGEGNPWQFIELMLLRFGVWILLTLSPTVFRSESHDVVSNNGLANRRGGLNRRL
jgi:hypothetical protein